MPSFRIDYAPGAQGSPHAVPFQRMVDSLPTPAYTCNASGEITSFNPAAELLWGRAPRLNDAEERYCGSFRLYTPTGEPLTHDACWMARALNEDTAFIERKAIIERSDGSRRQVLAHVNPIHDDAGRLLGAINVMIDTTERERTEAALRESEQRLNLALGASRMGVWEWNVVTNEVLWSPESYEILGAFKDPLTLDVFKALVHPEDLDYVMTAVTAAIREHRRYRAEFRIVRDDGSLRWVCNHGTVDYDHCGAPLRVVGTIQDITDRKLAESALLGQNQVLEQIASGASLTTTLDKITEFVEADLPGSICSILLLDEGGRRLRFGAGKRVPPEYSAAIDGIEIGEGVGSCGTAAVRREAVISADIAKDALWQDYAACAIGHNLRACWSVPIIGCDNHRAPSSSTKVYGTFALYFRHPQAPRKGELGILHRAAQLAGIAIERDRFEKAIIADEARFRTLVDHASDAFFLMRDGGEIVDINGEACESLGYTREEIIGRTPAMFSARATPEIIRDLFQELRRTPKVTFDSAHRRKEGRVFPVEVRVAACEIEGKLMALAVARDVTDRRQSEARLKASQQHLLASQRIARVGSWEIKIEDALRPDGRADWSAECFRIFGRAPGDQEPSNQEFRSWLHPEDRLKLAEAITDALREHGVYELEYRLTSTDGMERVINERAEIVSDPISNLPIKLSGTSQDVTDRRRAERTVREREQRYRLLAEHAQVVLWEADPVTYRFTYVSEFAAELLGYPREQWYEEGFWPRHIHDEDRDRSVKFCMSETKLGRDHRLEYRMIHADGRTVWVEDVVTIVSEPQYSVLRGVIFDITTRKETERRLLEAVRSKAEALALLDALYAEAPVGLGLLSPDVRYLRCNQALADINGFPAEQHIGKSLEELLPDIWPQAKAMYQGILAGGGPVTNMVFVNEIVAAPGVTRHFLGSFYPVSVDDEMLGIGVIVNEVTEQKRIESAMLKSELRNRAIVDAMPDLMFRMDAEGRIIDYHAPHRADLLHSPDDFLGRQVHEILPPDVARLIAYNLEQTLATREIRTFEYQLAMSPEFHNSYEARMVPAGDNEVIAVVRDVTEPKRIEEQMRKLQKLEAVGRLAGGIAHDFNNLLTIINGYSELMLKKLAPTDAMLPPLTAVRDAGRRAANLVRQLLAFSREQVLRPEYLDINDVVTDMQPLVRGLVETDVELLLELDPRIELVRVDRTQLEQAIMNLVTNARDAMPRGGRLIIRTSDVQVGEPSPAAVGEVKPGRYMQLTVVDDGHGMTESVRAKIFEPFFTTKEVGRGTGLGLSTVDGIVRQSGGFVKVVSSVGHGTIVSILLPAATPPPQVL
ncbi:MAG: hypothetical protein C0483_08180 [Pirellula sp.]|nr:hypothetical protein [Pirellula sp.]